MTVKVAHVCAVPASLKFLLSDQLRYLEGRGYEMHAISSPGAYQDDIKAQFGDRWYPARISRSITPMQDLMGILDVARVCAREGFTIVHTHTPKGTMIGQLGARLARVPVVIQTLHGFYFIGVPEGFKRTMVRQIEVLACRDADHILSQNPEDVERIHREGLVADPARATVLGNGIDIQRFSPRSFGDEELRRRRVQLGLNPEGPIIGMVGRFVIEKGYRELCAAMKQIAARHEGAQVLAIGTNPSIDRPEEVVLPSEDAEVGDRFVCLYDRADMEELYQLMDIFVLPSWREGFPRAPMEAAATGLAVVTTDVRGCRQTVTDGDNGLIVEARDASGLAEAMDRLLSDPELCAQMGQRGRERAEREFDQTLVFERVADRYAALLRRAGIDPPT